jgi:hypothetical protein
MVHPEAVAQELGAWEAARGVDLLRTDRAEAWRAADASVPADARVLVVAEDLIWEPPGSAVFWAVPPRADDDGACCEEGADAWVDALALRVGFYYGLERVDGCCVWSLHEWADQMCACGVLSKVVSLGFQMQNPRFRPLLAKLSRAVDAEMEGRKTGLPLEFESGKNKRVIYRKRGLVLVE